MYPVLKLMEEQGSVRRGYFVAGLGAAQFAVPGAVDRLRDLRDAGAGGLGAGRSDPVVLAATDPAQPYGAALPWPPTDGRPARSAGALVGRGGGGGGVSVEGGGGGVLTSPAALVDPSWAAALADVVRSGRRRTLEVARIDGAPARESTHADTLRQAGFTDGYKGLVLRHR